MYKAGRFRTKEYVHSTYCYQAANVALEQGLKVAKIASMIVKRTTTRYLAA